MTENINLEWLLAPESTLECTLLQEPVFREGLLWGVPRYGHPEGEVYRHVMEVYSNIDRLQVSAETRQQLRLIALSHDTFKFQEHKGPDRDWSRHHAVLARRFMEQFTTDQDVLTVVEWHDEAYYAWRDLHLFNEPTRAAMRWERLLQRIKGINQLYYLFFKCDTHTGDKNPAPIAWVEAQLPGISKLDW